MINLPAEYDISGIGDIDYEQATIWLMRLLDDPGKPNNDIIEAMLHLKHMYLCACEINEEDDWLGAWRYEVTAYNIVWNKMKGLL
jgi:hypothetical protein